MLDAAFLSHVLLWFIGAMSVVGVVTMTGALILMGRTGYRKD
ncbi:hypothetical protein FM104_08765 [Microbacterium esteraromaticum]|uniref:Uncharacterized protein n=1 Tax=Microbacterium esteraromaticum TaxID=57043 RepID=A0A1R4JTN6_9MICO|nr:hypothetical protein [Microbacterium esteraromaticum]SJN35175.1 hypothetical protein FM104_08765 [Microbacterium esteraromaticum]